MSDSEDERSGEEDDEEEEEDEESGSGSEEEEDDEEEEEEDDDEKKKKDSKNNAVDDGIKPYGTGWFNRDASGRFFNAMNSIKEINYDLDSFALGYGVGRGEIQMSPGPPYRRSYSFGGGLDSMRNGAPYNPMNRTQYNDFPRGNMSPVNNFFAGAGDLFDDADFNRKYPHYQQWKRD